VSYCRFSSGDVYVFLSCTGVLECCACWLNEREDDELFPASFYALTTEKMIKHLWKHLDAGHEIPGYTFDGLRRDYKENDAWLASDEAKAERAKWRSDAFRDSDQPKET
jgi:hypothetical protein